LSTISRLFYQFSGEMPTRQAIWCEGVAFSYAEMANLVSRWACGMAARGVRRGDHVAVLLPNNVEFVALLLVAADLGTVLVPLNTSLPPLAVQRAFEASAVQHVVGNAATLEPLLASGLFAINNSNLWLSLDVVAKGVETLPDLIASTPVDAQPLFAGRDDDPFILTMTSGSTGDPKPIILTQRTKLNRARAAQNLYKITDADRTLAATPLYHSLAERLVLIPLLTGGTSILMSRFSATEWLRVVGEQQVSFTIAVSSQLRQILAQIAVEGSRAMASLRCLVSSSALLDSQVKADLLACLNCDFHECYGASEIAIASNLDSKSARLKMNSVGIAAPGVDIRILTEDGDVAPVGQIGEIACKTPMIFGGYFERPDMTAAAMWGDYFKTGDLGRLDEDGFLYFMGRQKEIIISGGINVYPNDIEMAVSAFPSVAESAAFPIQDERLGEIIGIALVAKEGAEFDLKQLRRYCAQQLADFQQPRKFFVLDKLPKNTMGKLMKHALVEKYGKC
jgi:long-chain acyl-CoA synthetase